MNRVLACLFAIVALLACAPAQARRTVCTITVNSPDEKQAFRRYLPESQYEFVELVERGRPDWLESACRKGVRCDVLIVSGHFNGNHFLSDQITAQEYLAVQEMERASCSDACPALFSQLNEVYLFGCDTLNRGTMLTVTPELVRGLMRSGHGESEARRIAQSLVDRYGESNRDIMRRVFKDVPVIYGFYDVAPLGATAAPLLSRYLQNTATREFATGRPSERLLRILGQNHLTAAEGMRSGDRRASYRGEVCRMVDDAVPPARKLAFVHALLGREMAEVRLAFDRIEATMAGLRSELEDPEVAAALHAITADKRARSRYLEFARDADLPRTRTRMLAVARAFGWLPGNQYQQELVSAVTDLLARSPMSPADVDLVCEMPEPDAVLRGLASAGVTASAGERADRSAALACLGAPDERSRMARLLTSADERDVQMAQIYFKHRPLTNADELRVVSSGIARMNAPAAQVRALETLAGQHVADAEALATLTRVYAQTSSVHVQRAVAGVLVRADLHKMATPEMLSTLRERRLRSPDGEDMVDVLLRRMAMHY